MFNLYMIMFVAMFSERDWDMFMSVMNVFVVMLMFMCFLSVRVQVIMIFCDSKIGSNQHDYKRYQNKLLQRFI